MKVIKSQVNKITISDIQHMDTINVFMENFHPGAGRITIEMAGDSWSHYWSNMGEVTPTIETFILKCNNDYIIRKLDCSIDSEIIDTYHQEEKVKKAIIKQRRNRECRMEKEYARELWDNLGELEDWGGSEHCPLICELYCDGWDTIIPRCPNPKYEKLDRIVHIVKEAIRSLDKEIEPKVESI